MYENMGIVNSNWPRNVALKNINCWEHNWYSPINTSKPIKFGKSTKRKRKSTKRKRKSQKRKKSKCQKFLQNKIKKNMKEWKLGRYKSQKQALAVSYSQTRKKYPRCKI